MRSGRLEEFIYADYIALFTEPVEDLKGKLEVWKRALTSKGLRVCSENEK